MKVAFYCLFAASLVIGAAMFVAGTFDLFSLDPLSKLFIMIVLVPIVIITALARTELEL